MSMQQREKLKEVGEKILESSRTELLLEMRFLGPALGSLGYRMDLSTRTIGTDAAFIRFNPTYLTQTYIEQPRRINRAYMHILMHCLFRHMFGAVTCTHAENPGLWDLACDIAAEATVDSLDYPCLRQRTSDLREETYRSLREQAGLLTAERIYAYFDRNFLMSAEDAALSWERADRILAEHEKGNIRSANLEVPGASGQDAGAAALNADKTAQNAAAGECRKPDMKSRPRPFRDEEKAALFERLRAEFTVDDHSFWERIPQEERKDPDIPEQKQPDIAVRRGREKEAEWEKTARRIEAEVTANRLASAQTGTFERTLQVTFRKKTSLADYLRKLTVLREESRIDPDSFDYGLYNFGMEFYGNMPLIEENEFRESRRIDELVIAIDTSGSTKARLVQEFLNETATVLASRETFFRRMRLHIIESDDRVQRDEIITDLRDLRKYADGFQVSGGFGTDFRPVFRYVEDLRRKGELRNLRGLLYFTDGYGTYPEKPTPYETAFVFLPGSDSTGEGVPDWAVKIFLDES